MWHPHFKRKRISEVNFEIVDSKRNDFRVLWKIFENEPKKTKFSKEVFSFNKKGQEIDSQAKEMKCECKFVKIKAKETDSDLISESLNLKKLLFNPTSNERNKLKSLLSQKPKNSDRYINTNNETFENIQLPDETFGKINQNVFQQNNFGKNYRMKQIPIDIITNPKMSNFNDMSSKFSNLINQFSNLKGVLENNFQNNGDNKNNPYLKSFLSPQSQEVKIPIDVETQSEISNRFNAINISDPKNLMRDITKNSENLNYNNLLYYLQLNSNIMKNLENLILSQPNKIFENNLNKEKSYYINDTDNSVITQTFKNYSKINHHILDQNILNAKLEKNNPENKKKNFRTQYNKENFEGSKNLEQDKTFSESSDAEVSNDLMQIVKNLNLNTSTQFDFKEIPQLDVSKFKEFLK